MWNNSGTPGQLNRALPIQHRVPGPHFTSSFTLFLFVNLSLAAFSPPTLYRSYVSGVGRSRLFYFNIWRGGPPAGGPTSPPGICQAARLSSTPLFVSCCYVSRRFVCTFYWRLWRSCVTLQSSSLANFHCFMLNYTYDLWAVYKKIRSYSFYGKINFYFFFIVFTKRLFYYLSNYFGTEFQGTSPTAACQSPEFPAANISVRPAFASWILHGIVAAHLAPADFLSLRSDGLEPTAWFVAWSGRRVWTLYARLKRISLPDTRDLSALRCVTVSQNRDIKNSQTYSLTLRVTFPKVDEIVDDAGRVTMTTVSSKNKNTCV